VLQPAGRAAGSRWAAMTADQLQREGLRLVLGGAAETGSSGSSSGSSGGAGSSSSVNDAAIRRRSGRQLWPSLSPRKGHRHVAAKARAQHSVHASAAAAAGGGGGVPAVDRAAAAAAGSGQHGHQHALHQNVHHRGHMRPRRLRVGSAGGAARAAQRRATSQQQQQDLRQQQEQLLLAQLQQLGLGDADMGVEGWLQGEGLRAVPEMVLRFLQDDADAAAEGGGGGD
jgi:hypothetical protein